MRVQVCQQFKSPRKLLMTTKVKEKARKIGGTATSTASQGSTADSLDMTVINKSRSTNSRNWLDRFNYQYIWRRHTQFFTPFDVMSPYEKLLQKSRAASKKSILVKFTVILPQVNLKTFASAVSTVTPRTVYVMLCYVICYVMLCYVICYVMLCYVMW